MTFHLTFRDPFNEAMIAEHMMAALAPARGQRERPRAQTDGELEQRVSSLEDTASDHEARLAKLEGRGEPAPEPEAKRFAAKTITRRAPAPKPRPKAQKAKATMAKPTPTPKVKTKPRVELDARERAALLNLLPAQLRQLQQREPDDALLAELARHSGKMPRAEQRMAMAIRMGTAELERRTVTERGVTRFGVLVPKHAPKPAPRTTPASSKPAPADRGQPSKPAGKMTAAARAMAERMGTLETHRVTVMFGTTAHFNVPVTADELAAGRTDNGGVIVSKPKEPKKPLPAWMIAAAAGVEQPRHVPEPTE